MKLRTSNEEAEKNEEDVSKKLLDFRKQWRTIHLILHLYCTQFIKYFHIMAFHIKDLNQLIAILYTAQQTFLKKKLTDQRLL